MLAVSVVDWLAFAGTFAFAVSGALLAARHRLDIIGFLFVANMTGVGGGTVRDLLLGAPVSRMLAELEAGQAIRHDGPQTLLAKAGTPTMGGVLILIGK